MQFLYIELFLTVDSLSIYFEMELSLENASFTVNITISVATWISFIHTHTYKIASVSMLLYYISCFATSSTSYRHSLKCGKTSTVIGVSLPPS